MKSLTLLDIIIIIIIITVIIYMGKKGIKKVDRKGPGEPDVPVISLVKREFKTECLGQLSGRLLCNSQGYVT